MLFELLLKVEVGTALTSQLGEVRRHLCVCVCVCVCGGGGGGGG